MGKGGVCVLSKKRVPKAAAPPEGSEGQSGSTPLPPLMGPRRLRVFIVFYSMYGHVESLSRRMKHGVDGIASVEGVLYHMAEILTPEVLEQMKAPPKGEGVSVISAEELAGADGLFFGFPTSFLYINGKYLILEVWGEEEK